MATQVFGSVCSRNPITGEKKIYATLYDFQSKRPFDVKNLPQNILEELTSKLKAAEQKLKFPVELLIVSDLKKLTIKHQKTAKLDASAYPQVLMSLLKEKLVTEKQVLQKMPLHIIPTLLSTKISPQVARKAKTLASGAPISFGASSGVVLFKHEDVLQALLANQKVIWILDEVSTEDLKLFEEVEGVILTASGSTSHAAVVARSIGKPAIIGAKAILDKKHLLKEVTIDGNTGRIYQGKLPLEENGYNNNLMELLKLAQKNTKITIQANADNFAESEKAKRYGASGIGLCRTEHMFKGKDRAFLIRQILFSEKPASTVLEQLAETQKQDFKEIFASQKDKPIIIRYLDSPLHEFAPKTSAEIDKLCAALNIAPKEVNLKMKLWKEQSPMLGYRGVRMLLKKPEILIAQTKAIITAALESNFKGEIGLEVPLIINEKEVMLFKTIVEKVIIETKKSSKLKLKFGAMIETPASTFKIEEISKLVDFISFGTNDLTQTTLGLSRDDYASFIDFYIEKAIIKEDPFVNLDDEIVLTVLKETIKKARKANPQIKISICGEQAASNKSIPSIADLDLDSISVNTSAIPSTYFASAKYSL